MAKLRVKRKAHKRRAYTRKDGTHVSATRVSGSTFKVKDRGKRGRTPKSKRWYEPTVETGWSKDSPQSTRLSRAVRAHKGDKLAAARGLQALSNVTTDPKTKRLADADAKILFKRHKEG